MNVFILPCTETGNGRILCADFITEAPKRLTRRPEKRVA